MGKAREAFQQNAIIYLKKKNKTKQNGKYLWDTASGVHGGRSRDSAHTKGTNLTDTCREGTGHAGDR